MEGGGGGLSTDLQTGSLQSACQIFTVNSKAQVMKRSVMKEFHWAAYTGVLWAW